MDIIEFLTARYDEAEEATHLAAAEPPHPSGLPLGTAICYGLESVGLSLNYQAYMTMFDPPDVLADIAAKRAIVAHHAPEADVRVRDGKYVQDPPLCTICWQPWPNKGKRQLHPCDTLRLLAAPFAEHPDFDPAWRAAK